MNETQTKNIESNISQRYLGLELKTWIIIALILAVIGLILVANTANAATCHRLLTYDYQRLY